ncbi:MAG: glycerate dehydrogenase [Saprospiraceae bacterium]|jgi:glycerate dehydrogenase
MAESIVILEGKATNPGDLSWKAFEEFGDVTVYENTTQESLVKRAKYATIIITNKLKIGRKELDQLPSLQLICQLATGYDNIDVKAAKEREIPVCNAVGYGTNAVAQHAIALLLAATNRVEAHNQFVQSSGWSKSIWSHSLTPLVELAGLTLGIYGYGKIGQQVGVIAKSLGMSVIATTRSPEKYVSSDVGFVSLKDLFKQSDVISLHAPLSTSNN